MDPHLITPLLLSAVVLWAIYRRVRRSVGRQSVNTPRLYVRLAVLTVVGLTMLAASAHSIDLLAALVGGGAGGIVLGFLGLKHTKFEVTPQGRFYTPHTYLGLFVTALFLARLLYRFLTVYGAAQAPPQAPGNMFAAYQKSPMTLALFGLLIGYYLVFNLGVLRRSRSSTALPPAANV